MLMEDCIVPRMIRRKCGGWIALSSRDCWLKIGVVGKTESEARSKFQSSFSEWIETLKS